MSSYISSVKGSFIGKFTRGIVFYRDGCRDDTKECGTTRVKKSVITPLLFYSGPLTLSRLYSSGTISGVESRSKCG